MSEGSGERQFEATTARLRKARQDGDTARSSDLTGALGFAAGLMSLAIMIPALAASATRTLERAISRPEMNSAPSALALAAYSLLPLAAAACAAVAAGMLQTGGLRFSAVGLKLERLNPAEGLRRMLSREVLMAAVRGAVAVCCVFSMFAPLLFGVLSRGVRTDDISALAGLAWNSAMRIGWTGAGVAIVFGGFDLALIFGRWRKRLRMTFNELKRDQKENDGDPLVRSRRRAMQRKFSRAALGHIQDAAFVVVNPTHIAVALEYRPPEVAVPRVLIRAADQAALRVRTAATKLKVPIIEDRTLARALYETAGPGQLIPKELYVAVASLVVALARRGSPAT